MKNHEDIKNDFIALLILLPLLSFIYYINGWTIDSSTFINWLIGWFMYVFFDWLIKMLFNS